MPDKDQNEIAEGMTTNELQAFYTGSISTLTEMGLEWAAYNTVRWVDLALKRNDPDSQHMRLVFANAILDMDAIIGEHKPLNPDQDLED